MPATLSMLLRSMPDGQHGPSPIQKMPFRSHPYIGRLHADLQNFFRIGATLADQDERGESLRVRAECKHLTATQQAKSGDASI